MIRDWELVCVVSGGLAFIAFISTFSWAMFGQILAPSLMIGFTVVLIRRGLLKAKRSIFNREKKQAV